MLVLWCQRSIIRISWPIIFISHLVYSLSKRINPTPLIIIIIDRITYFCCGICVVDIIISQLFHNTFPLSYGADVPAGVVVFWHGVAVAVFLYGVCQRILYTTLGVLALHPARLLQSAVVVVAERIAVAVDEVLRTQGEMVVICSCKLTLQCPCSHDDAVRVTSLSVGIGYVVHHIVVAKVSDDAYRSLVVELVVLYCLCERAVAPHDVAYLQSVAL